MTNKCNAQSHAQTTQERPDTMTNDPKTHKPESLNDLLLHHQRAFDEIVASLDTIEVPVTLTITTREDRTGWSASIFAAKAAA